MLLASCPFSPLSPCVAALAPVPSYTTTASSPFCLALSLATHPWLRMPRNVLFWAPWFRVCKCVNTQLTDRLHAGTPYWAMSGPLMFVGRNAVLRIVDSVLTDCSSIEDGAGKRTHRLGAHTHTYTRECSYSRRPARIGTLVHA